MEDPEDLSMIQRCRHGQTFDTRFETGEYVWHKCPLCSDDWCTSCDEYDRVNDFLERQPEK